MTPEREQIIRGFRNDIAILYKSSSLSPPLSGYTLKWAIYLGLITLTNVIISEMMNDN